MPTRSSKPRDANRAAKHILDQLLDDAPKEDQPPVPVKNAAAVELGRLGGMKGGRRTRCEAQPHEAIRNR